MAALHVGRTGVSDGARPRIAAHDASLSGWVDDLLNNRASASLGARRPAGGLAPRLRSAKKSPSRTVTRPSPYCARSR